MLIISLTSYNSLCNMNLKNLSHMFGEDAPFYFDFEMLNQAGNWAFVCLGDFVDAAVINIQLENTRLFFLPTKKPAA